jgi:hypothetical protein
MQTHVVPTDTALSSHLLLKFPPPTPTPFDDKSFSRNLLMSGTLTSLSHEPHWLRSIQVSNQPAAISAKQPTSVSGGQNDRKTAVLQQGAFLRLQELSIKHVRAIKLTPSITLDLISYAKQWRAYRFLQSLKVSVIDASGKSAHVAGMHPSTRERVRTQRQDLIWNW